jgi:hypothetical protein
VRLPPKLGRPCRRPPASGCPRPACPDDPDELREIRLPWEPSALPARRYSLITPTLPGATSGLEPGGDDCGQAGYQGSGDDADCADKGNNNEGEIPGHGYSSRAPSSVGKERQVRAIAHRSCVVVGTIRCGLWLINAARCGSPSTATAADDAPVVGGCLPTSCKTPRETGRWGSQSEWGVELRMELSGLLRPRASNGAWRTSTPMACRHNVRCGGMREVGQCSSRYSLARLPSSYAQTRIVRTSRGSAGRR